MYISHWATGGLNEDYEYKQTAKQIEKLVFQKAQLFILPTVM